MLNWFKKLFRRRDAEDGLEWRPPGATLFIERSRLRAPEPVSSESDAHLSPHGNVADEGEQVCCANGHVICRCVEDLKIGTDNWGRCFGYFYGIGEPEIGGPVPPCYCGAPWLDADWGLYVLTSAGPEYRRYTEANTEKNS